MGFSFLRYLVIVLENPSTTRAERSLAVEKERAILYVYERKSEIKIYAAAEIYFPFFEEIEKKTSTAAKERNLL
jgi:hypothetical protein